MILMMMMIVESVYRKREIAQHSKALQKSDVIKDNRLQKTNSYVPFKGNTQLVLTFSKHKVLHNNYKILVD